MLQYSLAKVWEVRFTMWRSLKSPIPPPPFPHLPPPEYMDLNVEQRYQSMDSRGGSRGGGGGGGGSAKISCINNQEDMSRAFILF